MARRESERGGEQAWHPCADVVIPAERSESRDDARDLPSPLAGEGVAEGDG